MWIGNFMVAMEKANKSALVLPEGFTHEAAKVSDILNDEALSPGLYLRTLKGNIIPASFSNELALESLNVEYDIALSWPKTDFVYDARLECVFSNQGCNFFYNYRSSQSDRGDIEELVYLVLENDQYFVRGGNANIPVDDDIHIASWSVDIVRPWEETGRLVSDKSSLSPEIFNMCATYALASQALQASITNPFWAERLAAISKAKAEGKSLKGFKLWENIAEPEKKPLDMGSFHVLTYSHRQVGDGSRSTVSSIKSDQAVILAPGQGDAE